MFRAGRNHAETVAREREGRRAAECHVTNRKSPSFCRVCEWFSPTWLPSASHSGVDRQPLLFVRRWTQVCWPLTSSEQIYAIIELVPLCKEQRTLAATESNAIGHPPWLAPFYRHKTNSRGERRGTWTLALTSAYVAGLITQYVIVGNNDYIVFYLPPFSNGLIQ